MKRSKTLAERVTNTLIGRAFGLVFLASSYVVIGTQAFAADDKAMRKAEEEVHRAVNAKLAAYASPNVDKYFSFYADDMSFCCSRDAWSSKQNYYMYWKDRVLKGDGPTKAVAKGLRLQATPRADAVIASYQMPITLGGSQPQDQFFNMNEVWVKKGSRWLVKSLFFSAGKVDSAGPISLVSPKP